MSSTTTNLPQRYHQYHQHQKARSVITELWFVGLQDPQTPTDPRTWDVSAAQVSGIGVNASSCSCMIARVPTTRLSACYCRTSMSVASTWPLSILEILAAP